MNRRDDLLGREPLGEVFYAVNQVGDRHRGVCRCGWSTADTYNPGFAEREVRDHARVEHGWTHS